MVTDQQVRRLFKLIQTKKNFGIAAMKAGMDEKNARKYCKQGKLPSELKEDHIWRTRKDPFGDIWDDMKSMLKINPGLEAKTLFDDLQRRQSGKFADGQLRTLQRRVKHWRAVEGPAKEVFFAQIHKPGKLCQSDFTHMDKLGVTIRGIPFDYMIYHFVLTYSNWETGTVCFSESFESLSQGVQNALWELGGVPEEHRTDCLSTAVNKTGHPEIFTRRYKDLVDYYGIAPCEINPSSPHGNGKDVKVGPSSTIRVNQNVYSVNSRLIGESIQLKAIYFIRSITIIALSAFLFSTTGIHVLHPFLHHHSKQFSQCSALAASKQSPAFIHTKQIEYQANQNCPICSFLKHFYIYKIKRCTFGPLLALLPIFRFLFKSDILKRIDYLLIPPRSPPCLF